MRLGKSRSRGKRNLLIAVGVLAAVAILYFVTRLFMTEAAEELYLKAEKRNFDKAVQLAEKTYAGFMEKQAPYLKQAHRRRTEISAELNADGGAFGTIDIDGISRVLGKSKLVIDTKKQPGEGNSITNVSLLLEKVPFLDAELISNRQSLYFSVPVLMPGKYFSAERDRLDELYDKFSIPVRPKKLPSGLEIASVLEFDAAGFRESADKLNSAVSKYFTKDTVKYGEQRDLLISGETVMGMEIVVTLNEESATALLHELTGLIAQEDALLRYTYGNFAGLSTLAEDAGLFQMVEYMDQTGIAVMNEIERGFLESLKADHDVDGFRKVFQETMNRYRVKDGLRMTVVVDRDANILERKLVLNMQNSQGDGGIVLDIATGCSNTSFEDARNRFTDIVATRYGKGEVAERITELHIKPEFIKNGNETQGSIAMEYAVTPQGGERTGIKADLKYLSKPDELTLKNNKTVEFKVKLYGETGDGTLEGEWNNTSWENNKLNSRNSISKLSFYADLPFLGINNFSGVINLAGEDRFGIEPFELPEISQDRVTDLIAATQDDLNRIEMEIFASFGAFYLNNKPFFDAFIGK